MIKRIFYPIIILTLLIFGCQKSSNLSVHKANNSLTVSHAVNKGGDNAYDFSLQSVSGKTVKLTDYKGKVVILDFWATWCGPCRRGIPDLIDIQKKYKNKVAVLGISLDQDNTKADLVPFIKNIGINYPVLYANMDVVMNYGNIQAIPTTFIIDQSGKIVYKNIGLTSKSVFIETIDNLLKKS